jgi:hypothetical protein
MVEDIGLNTFVFLPYFVSGEEINLDRYAIFGSFFLADYQVKILVYYRQTA